MEFRLLGPLEVVDEGEPIDLGPRKQRALLCLLLLHANRVVTTNRILEELWGDDAGDKERALWTVISRLRSALEPDRDGHGESSVLLTRDHGYLLQLDPSSIDLNRFEADLQEARQLLQSDPGAVTAHVDEMLSHWRGQPCGEFHDEEFARLEVPRIEELRLEALEIRADAELRQGRGREQIGTLETLAAQNPYRERFVALLMRSLYQSGRAADALRAFDRQRRTMGEDLGIEPSPELRRLEEQILLHDPVIGDRRREATLGDTVRHNPFKGLRSFGEDDADDFFGRDHLVSDVVRRLDRGDRLVALVGASGSGKSSAVRAGVVPAIRKAAITDSDLWLVAQMTPGAHPLIELEAALLRSTLDAPDSLKQQLAEPDDGLLRAALRVIPDRGRLLLVIDQFEELFTLVEAESERQAFIDLLGPALDDPRGRVMVMLTLRADFYERPLRYPDLAQRLGDGIVNVSTLSTDELETAVAEPMRRAGVAMEPTLLATLLTDVIGQPGALPLFQYTLTMLFDRREGDVVTLDAYTAMGGIRGALAQRAEDLWAELGDDEQIAARQLVLRLVTISGERDWSRRRVLASELTSMPGDLVATQRAIEVFGTQRLLAFDRDQVTGSPTVEVAHEALLTEWPRLRGWIDEAGSDIVRHSTLVAAMNEWNTADRNPDYLLVGQRLVDYETWADTATLELSATEQTFIRESTAARDDADRDEAERTGREQAMAGRVRRRTYGLVVVVVALIGGGAAAWLFGGEDPRPRIAYAASPFGPDAAIEVQMRAGWAQAQLELDFDAVLLEPVSDPAEEIEALAATGPDLIVSSQDVGGAIPEIAIDHPDTWFVAFHNFPADFGIDNLTTITIDAADGSFLAGAAAALTTETDIIGFLGGRQEIIDPFRAGYEAGARHVNPNIEIVSLFLVGDGGGVSVFTRPKQGAEGARALYNAGADVVFHAAGESGDLIPAVADEITESGGPTRWVIGVDTDQWLAVGGGVRDHVLTSMIKRNDFALRVGIDRFTSGDLEPGVISLGLSDGAVGYSTSGDNLTDDIIERLDELSAKVVDGSIVVPHIPDAAATIHPPADTTVAVSWDGTTCTVGSEVPAVGLGDVLRINFENQSDGDGVVAVSSGSSGEGNVVLAVPARPGRANAGSVNVTTGGTWTLWCNGDEATRVVATELDVVLEDDAAITGTLTIGAGAGCSYDGATRVPAGSKVLIDVVRESDVEVAVWLVDDDLPIGLWFYGPEEAGLVGLRLVPPHEVIVLGCSIGGTDRPAATLFIEG